MVNSITVIFFSFHGGTEDGKETVTQSRAQAETGQIFMKFPASTGAQGLVEDADEHTGRDRVIVTIL